MSHYMSSLWDDPCGRVAIARNVEPQIPMYIAHRYEDLVTNSTTFNFLGSNNTGHILNNTETLIAEYRAPRAGLIRIFYEGIDNDSLLSATWSDTARSVFIKVRCTSPSGRAVNDTIVTASCSSGDGPTDFAQGTARRAYFSCHVKAGEVIQVYSPFPRVDGVDSITSDPTVYKPRATVAFLLDW